MSTGKEWTLIEALLGGQRFAVLATQDRGAPYTSLVAFAVTPDLRELVFPTRAGTRKFAHLAANPRVALLVDNRSNSAEDYRQAAALTAIGEAKLEPGAGDADFRALLLERHPMLAGFLAEPDCRMARIHISEYRLVTEFETTCRLDPNAPRATS